MMRIFLYILAGICSASLGWNIGHLFLSDMLSGVEFIYTRPEIILFPCVATALAIGLVLNEILLSNPTRLYLAYRKAQVSVLVALGFGLVIGLFAGIIFQILLAFSLPNSMARILGWLTIGFAVGCAEGFSWKVRSIESGDSKRSFWRLVLSIGGAMIASFVAALLFEFFRSNLQEIPKQLKEWEDFAGFCILGIILGLTFCFTSSPSYMAALRAGAGFEFIGDYGDNRSPATIKTALLKFLSESSEGEIEKKIEEGLSIQLPGQGKITIGSPSNKQADICLPGVKKDIASIIIQGHKAYLKPEKSCYTDIRINGKTLSSFQERIMLKHNTMITFSTTTLELELMSKVDEDNATTQKEISYPKMYRFVYYNRFFDPQG